MNNVEFLSLVQQTLPEAWTRRPGTTWSDSPGIYLWVGDVGMNQVHFTITPDTWECHLQLHTVPPPMSRKYPLGGGPRSPGWMEEARATLQRQRHSAYMHVATN